MDLHGDRVHEAIVTRLQTLVERHQHNLDYYYFHSVRWLELLLVSSQRAGHEKLHSVFAALQKSFAEIADDFDLKRNIHGFLLEQGHVRHRTYLVRDLRKFPIYAGIIDFSDNKRFKPDKKIPFDIPDGWILGFAQLVEKPVFPKEIEKTLRDKHYIIDANYPIPDRPEFKAVKDALPKVLYWRIRKFQQTLTGLIPRLSFTCSRFHNCRPKIYTLCHRLACSFASGHRPCR